MKPCENVVSDSEEQFVPPTKVLRLDSNLNTRIVSADNCQPKPSSSKVQSSMFSYVVILSASQKFDIDKSIARFFYSSNIAFNISKSTEFIQFK